MNRYSRELVSIIIPVYNTVDYLRRCVDSALRQTYNNLQIILIDDGSTDGCDKVCDAYAAADDRIKVIHQENSGQSAARNAGLERVKGRWVTFLDSDDYISNHFVENNLNACLRYGAEISICRYIVDYDGTIEEDGFIKSDRAELFTNREAVIHHFGKEGSLFNIVCCKLYDASLWKNLRFPVGKIWEDVFVSHALFYNAKTVLVSDARLYAYFMAPGSTMRKPFALKRLDALDSWTEGVRFFYEAGEYDFYDIARRVLCNRLFDAYVICKKQLPDERGVHNELRRRSIAMYDEVRRIRSYIDLTPKLYFFYRVKQFIGRYCPALYSAAFIKFPTYNI